VHEQLQGLGFERGWGSTAGATREVMQLLLDILEAPDASTLELFLSRLPHISDIVVISPHGYFGQKDVLGLPDTGGQVVYILDQVRPALACRAASVLPDESASCPTSLQHPSYCVRAWQWL
jgi:hypothetical protein